MKIKRLLFFAFAISALVSCVDHDLETDPSADADKALYVLNEGGYGMNNASLSIVNLETGTVANDVYSTKNGEPLGDTANDIIVADDMVIIAVNGSNIIQFCDLDGNNIGQTEVPACRKMVADEDYLYVTSYAHDGVVYKVRLSDYKPMGYAEVGYEPEGIALFNGKLYVANSGGYAYLGNHGYEQTISIVDPTTMEETSKVETGLYNLYGGFMQDEKNKRYILVNASGDYGSNPAGSFIFDCAKDKVVATFDFPATYIAQYDGDFYTLGSTFSYTTYSYEYSAHKIFMNSDSAEVTDWAISGLDAMKAPYGIAITSDGSYYVADAGDYSTRGTLYHFSNEGEQLSSETVGVCPGHFAVR